MSIVITKHLLIFPQVVVVYIEFLKLNLDFLSPVGDTGTIAAELVKSLVDDFIYVNADMVAVAMLHLFENDNIIVECSAAVGLAALRSEKLKYLQGKK